jgi:SNF2 family DNA or RNA helicase|tara:strand:+ start:601 stop:2061 length:1461 start_codon:yes stop_codon:yes gene_type:complete
MQEKYYKMLDFFKTMPYEHQKEAFDASADKDNYALLMDMGTGKSKVDIDTTAYNFEKGRINFSLMISPKAVVANLASEIETHLPDRIPRQIVIWQPSLTKTKRKELNDLSKKDPTTLKFLLMNVEAFSSKKGVDIAEYFVKHNDVLMTVDESTTIKNRKAKRTKAICKIGRGCIMRRILTGFPVTRSPMDLYSQMDFLDPGILGFKSYFAFQGRYAVVQRRTMGAHSFNHIVGFRRLDELTEKLKNYSYRVRKEDCLDLPDKVYIKRNIELTKEQNDAYVQMKHLALARLNNGELSTTKNVLTQIMRLQQICCGHLTDDNGNVHKIKSNRLSSLLDICDEIQGKAIIWATWTMDIRSITEALRDRFSVLSVSSLHGETPDSERQKIVESFQDRQSELRFLVGHPRTGGFGLTLTAATTVIYYSNSYDLELRLQSEDRAHRIGQTNKVTYVDLISPSTVDEKIVRALRSKINIADQILGEQSREWLK